MIETFKLIPRFRCCFENRYKEKYSSSPAKDEYYASIEYMSALNQIIAGTDTVENMFAAFKADCMSKNMQKAIDEVTKIMAYMGK